MSSFEYDPIPAGEPGDRLGYIDGGGGNPPFLANLSALERNFTEMVTTHLREHPEDLAFRERVVSGMISLRKKHPEQYTQGLFSEIRDLFTQEELARVEATEN